MTIALLVLLLGVLAITLGYWQSRTIQDRLRERGLDIGAGLSANSVTTLINYNYVAAEQLANEAAQDNEIVYVIVHDKEGRVAGYSGRPDLQSKFLDDEISRGATDAIAPLTQKTVVEGVRYPVLDVAVPVIGSQSGIKWGTIRVGLSFAAIYRQVRQLIAIILVIGAAALAIGTLVAFWSARKITEPLKRLVTATVEATHGELRPRIEIRTNDEIEILADNFSTMMREILRHKQTLETQLLEIQHMQKYTASLLSSMNDGLLSYDLQGRIRSMNPAACELLGLAPADSPVGDTITAILGDRNDLRRHIDAKLTQPVNAPHKEISIKRPSDEQVLIVGTSILEDRNGKPEEIILNLHDITTQKKMEARVRQAERLAALGTLAAGMAHEIRNPLSAIKTFVQLLPRKLSKPGFLEKFNRTVPREITRINLLVEDLLDLARKPRYEFRPTEIGSLLRQNIELVEEELRTRGVECRLRGQDVLPPVSADKNQLNKAFQNLIRNAIQAMPNGGRLTIDARLDADRQHDVPRKDPSGPWICIDFEDTGMGIADEIIGNIFNPFFTSKDQGTGLGLAITHKVVTEHGGHIEASSRVDQGTRFSVFLKVVVPDGPTRSSLVS